MIGSNHKVPVTQNKFWRHYYGLAVCQSITQLLLSVKAFVMVLSCTHLFVYLFTIYEKVRLTLISQQQACCCSCGTMMSQTHQR